MPFTKYQENVIPEHKYLITSQRELQSEMSRNANSIYMVKNIEILQKRNLKSIANVLETKKKKNGLIYKITTEEARYSLPVDIQWP